MTTKEFKNIAPNLYQLKKLGCGFSVPNDYFNKVETTTTFDLLNPNKGQVFNTPENYFDTIEDSIFEKIQKNETEFSIPKDYFDTIEEKVFSKIHNQPKVINLKTRILKQMLPIAAAASILLFFSLQFLNTKAVETDIFTTLETSEIENWIANNELDLYTYDIASIYEDKDFENLEISSLYEDDEMLNYLNDVDVESLLLSY